MTKINLKKENVQLLKVAAISLLIGLLLGAMLVYAQSSNTFTISSGVYPGAPSYTIYKEGSTYYAKNAYGAIGYSGTDAATVIQSAINAINGRGHIFIKAGVYDLYSPISYTGDYFELCIEGEIGGLNPYAPYCTVLRKQFNGDMLTLNSSNYQLYANFYLKNLRFLGNRTNYTGRGLVVSGPSWSIVENCHFSDMYGNAIRIVNSKVIRIVRCQVYNSQNESGVYLSGVVDSQIYDLEVCIPDALANTALEIGSGCGLQIFGGHFEGYYGIKTASQIEVIGASLPHAYSNNIYVAYSSCVFIGCFLTAPNQGNFTDSNGANVLTISPKTVLTGCWIDSGGKATYGFYGFNNSNSTLIGNEFYGTFSVSPIRLVSGERYKHNIGFVTENSGTATIPSGQNITIVNHGLAATPTMVIVTGTTSDTADAYVLAVTSTVFTIAVPSPVGGNRTVYWYAEYKP